MNKCKHKKIEPFHENAPWYCPKCDTYIDGSKIKLEGNPVPSLGKIKQKIDNEHSFDNLDYALGYEQCYEDVLEILQNGVETDKEQPITEKVVLFTYGSILLSNMTMPIFHKEFKPTKSVFIKGYRLDVVYANSNKYPKYHFIQLIYTGKEKDIIPGFITIIPKNLIKKLDKWEGQKYERKNIVCYDRELNEINCQTYLGRTDIPM